VSTPVEKIKERLNIVDLLGTYIKLEKAGKNMKARCPFHNEKTPSFFVSPDRDSYYCFGCGAKGDIFTFVQEFEGVDFFGALKMLAEKTGVTLERGSFEKKDDKEAIFNALEAATQFFESNLSRSQSAKNYLEKRGLTEKTIKDWRIGFVADDWRTLYDYLTARKFSDNEIEQAGLIKRNERSFYDRFRGRIMFPIRDSVGRVVGFTGRILPENETRLVAGQTVEAAKYLNSPETSVFNKSRIIYGFDMAKLAIKKFDYSVIVEGQMDIIMCHQAGFQNVVATSGTALTPEHLTLLRRISNRVIMAFDADKAGVNAATKAWQLALSLGMEVKIAEFKDGKDPADVILKDKEKFKEALKDSMHIIDFYLSKILAENLESRKLGGEVREKILPFLVLIESSIEKSHWVKKISDKCGIAEPAIWEDLKKVKIEPGVAGVEIKVSNFAGAVLKDRLDSIERRILGVINWQEKDLSAQAGTEKIIDIEKSKARVKEIIGEDNFKKWQETPESILNEATFEAEQYYDKNKIQSVLDELLMELEKEYIKKDLALAMSEMIIAEKEKDFKKRDTMAEKCNELTKRLAKLK
jgi:DNA primase